MTTTPRSRLQRRHAEETYIRAGELEVFRQLRRDGEALDDSLREDRAIAVGPFSRLRADVVVDELGKTRGAINNLWGNQEAFRAAVMRVFLNDDSLGRDDVRSPDPAASATFDDWVARWAEAEIERGPRHGMDPENRYGLRWAAWLGLVPYGIWSESVSSASLDEFRLGVERFATEVIGPALEHFRLILTDDTTITDLAAAISSLVEGTWLNSALTASDPLGTDASASDRLARSFRLILHGATTAVD